MSLVDDDSSEDFGGLFENGHWDWDEVRNELKFISDTNEYVEEITLAKGAPTGTIHFKDDIDQHEQIRFKNRYQRKVKFGKREVVTLQDVKDVAIYTAPTNIMSEVLINMLHRPTTERFIRALILYCQYYLQIFHVMSDRKKSLETKIRTPQSDQIENEYRDNLCDLRLLAAKQYCTITIELEVNRLFKTDVFNSVEHHHQTGFITNMTPEERNVFLGHCLRHDTKLKTRSPLVNEVFCYRPIDYRLLSLADVKHDKLPPRLRYLQLAVAAPEEDFEANKTVVGILGLPRARFDAVLNPISVHQNHPKNNHSTVSTGITKSASTWRKSVHEITMKKSERKSLYDIIVMKKSSQHVTVKRKLFPDIVIPAKEKADVILPNSFPEEKLPVPRCNFEQRDRWISRHNRILNARKSTKSNTYV